MHWYDFRLDFAAIHATSTQIEQQNAGIHVIRTCLDASSECQQYETVHAFLATIITESSLDLIDIRILSISQHPNFLGRCLVVLSELLHVCL